MKLIDLHKQWMETGMLPKDGLCNSLRGKYATNLKKHFDKTIGEYGTFWAYPLTYQQQIRHSYTEMALSYTPLRQTIVLLICAMNNEL